ncbi:MAG TPA: asparagine synthase-related protein [Gemmatimonadaceae bacterium]|nr:asparagine synthase-related protein [Gemmatimonadaceae bacterium]
MGGIAGIARREPSGVKSWTLARMAGAIRHRGPDGFGLYVGARVGLAHVRLSVIDLAGGMQPLANEDGQVIITYNGEVYNAPELRLVLEAAGHRFRTRCDTEVLVHAYEEWGTNMLSRLNGQFAFAIYDRRTETVFLARDRFGVRPLFYAARDDALYFASEAKALFASTEVCAAADPIGIDEAFALWAAQPPRTVFAGVSALEPGTFALWSPGGLRVSRYYDLSFQPDEIEPPGAVEELDALLRRSVALRLRADVPIAGYRRGDAGSEIACALGAAQDTNAFAALSLEREGAAAAIAEVFPAVVWHAETPLGSTGAARGFLLADHARERGYTVVLTGEGADHAFLAAPLPRMQLARGARDFYTTDFTARLGAHDALRSLRERVDGRLRTLSPVNRAAYLAFTTLLSPHLLASESDRAALAHGVEARFPFLDHIVFEFAARLPTASKCRGPDHGPVLDRWAARALPGSPRVDAARSTHAPDAATFEAINSREYVRDLLTERALREGGVFSPAAVHGLLRRIGERTTLATRERQAFIGLLSHALWHDAFVAHPVAPAHLSLAEADVLIHESSFIVDRRSGGAAGDAS